MEVEELRQKRMPLLASLDERGRRLLLAAEARALGRGGIELVHRATGFSRPALARGIRELAHPSPPLPGRIRRPGGGRKCTVERDPTLRSDLAALVAPATRGDPESRLPWTSKSLRALSRELNAQGHRVKTWTVAGLLAEAGYSLQGNRKTKEGGRRPDRNAQFEHIHATVIEHQKAGPPVVSVDAKKKELVATSRTPGRRGAPRECPSGSGSTTSSIPRRGRRSRTASTT